MFYLHDLSKLAHYGDINDGDNDSVGDDDNENNDDDDNDDEEDDNDGGITELPLNPLSLNKFLKPPITKVRAIVKMFRNMSQSAFLIMILTFLLLICSIKN